MDLKLMESLKAEISAKAKNGVDFIFASSIIWLLISFIWMLPHGAYQKSVFTFFASGLMLPMALAFSKILKTTWTIKGNPLQPLGLILNFAQLFYFPFLVFVLLRQPEFFVMTYAIITGAHLFPYGWFYNQRAYYIFAGVIALGSTVIALSIPTEFMYLVPLYTTVSMLVLGAILFLSCRLNVAVKNFSC